MLHKSLRRFLSKSKNVTLIMDRSLKPNNASLPRRSTDEHRGKYRNEFAARHNSRGDSFWFAQRFIWRECQLCLSYLSGRFREINLATIIYAMISASYLLCVNTELKEVLNIYSLGELLGNAETLYDCRGTLCCLFTMLSRLGNVGKFT